jgi:hypothetical protein
MTYDNFINTLKQHQTPNIKAMAFPKSCALQDIPDAFALLLPDIIKLLEQHTQALVQKANYLLVLFGLQPGSIAIRSHAPFALQRIINKQHPDYHSCCNLTYLVVYISRLLQDEIACVAVNESFDVFDVTNIQSQAWPILNRQFQLTGHKLQIPQVAKVNLFILATQIPALAKINFKPSAFFIAEKNSHEMTVRNNSESMGDVVFTDLKLNVDHVVGNLRDGLFILCQLLEFERSLYGVLATGFVRPVIKKCEQRLQEHQNTVNRCGSVFSTSLNRCTDRFNHAER